MGDEQCDKCKSASVAHQGTHGRMRECKECGHRWIVTKVNGKTIRQVPVMFGGPSASTVKRERTKA